DYARWVAFQLSAWPPRDDPDEGPVRRATLRESQQGGRSLGFTAQRDAGGLNIFAGSYGMGWFSWQTCAFDRVVEHAGGLPGYGSDVAFLPDHGAGFFVFANLTYSSPTPVMVDAMRALVADGLLPARPRPPAPELEVAYQAVGSLLAAWDAERARALF